jgi:gluconolactonase
MTTFQPKVLANQLRFPEGPVVLTDGSVVFVEIERGTLMRLLPSGKLVQVAYLGGGPNGAALGPDGAIYVCNNGGFEFLDEPGMLRPIGTPDSYVGSSIQRVDLTTGEVNTLYGGARGPLLKGTNDLVFDRSGNFWFTDMGKTREGTIDRARVFYASIDGSMCKLAINHMLGSNGIGLSPDERTLYVAETVTGRLWAFELAAAGQIVPRPWPSPNGGRLLYGSANLQYFDSMAIEACGNICVGTLIKGGITVISPEGELVEHVEMPDIYATNLCFGGEDGRTAYITLSTSGQLVSVRWPRPGLVQLA